MGHMHLISGELMPHSMVPWGRFAKISSMDWSWAYLNTGNHFHPFSHWDHGAFRLKSFKIHLSHQSIDRFLSIRVMADPEAGSDLQQGGRPLGDQRWQWEILSKLRLQWEHHPAHHFFWLPKGNMCLNSCRLSKIGDVEGSHFFQILSLEGNII